MLHVPITCDQELMLRVGGIAYPIFHLSTMVHFIVASLVAKPLNRSEAKEGGGGGLLGYKTCCFSNVNYFVIMLSRYWSLPLQGHLQPHSKSKAWQLSTQL